MQEPKSKRGRKRVYDAERTRETILNAAEAVFAEHGFDGVSVDVIAAEAGYNKSLIFQYFGDKLGLYRAVVARMKAQTDAQLAQLIADFRVEHESLVPTTMTLHCWTYFVRRQLEHLWRTC